MLRFTMMRGRLHDDPLAALENLTATLSSEYRSVIAPTVRTQSEILGIQPDPLYYSINQARTFFLYSRAKIRCGEIFYRPGELFGIFVRDPRETYDRPQSSRVPQAFLCCASALSEADSHLVEFVELAKGAFGVEFEEIDRTSERAQAFMAESRTPVTEPRPEEVVGAAFLKDRTSRTLLQAIKASGGLLVSDLPKQVPSGEKERLGDIQANLLDAKLLDQEIVVVCTKSNSPVLRYDSAAAAKAIDEVAFRCTCGRDFKDERREEALRITPLGRELVDKSRWLTVLLVQHLRDLGVPLEHVFVEQIDGGDEMDCLALISGDLVLFELKDKEFSLGHAYSFAAKVGLLRPDLSVIVTTDKVGNDAKDHFLRAQQANLDAAMRRGGARSTDTGPIYVEGVESLDNVLDEIGTRLATADAARAFEELFMLAAVHPTAVLPALLGAPFVEETDS